MPWERKKGFVGLIYVPDKQPACERKHNCKDCFSCQMCSDIRCKQCLCGKKKKGGAKSHRRD